MHFLLYVGILSSQAHMRALEEGHIWVEGPWWTGKGQLWAVEPASLLLSSIAQAKTFLLCSTFVFKAVQFQGRSLTFLRPLTLWFSSNTNELWLHLFRHQQDHKLQECYQSYMHTCTCYFQQGDIMNAWKLINCVFKSSNFIITLKQWAGQSRLKLLGKPVHFLGTGECRGQQDWEEGLEKAQNV